MKAHRLYRWKPQTDCKHVIAVAVYSPANQIGFPVFYTEFTKNAKVQILKS